MMNEIHFGYNTLRNHGFIPGLQFHKMETHREKSKWIYCPGDFVYDCFQELDKADDGSFLHDLDGSFLLTHTPESLVKADEDTPVHGLVLFPSITTRSRVDVLVWEQIWELSNPEFHLPNVVLIHDYPRSGSVSTDRIIVLLGILEALLRRFLAAPEHISTGFIIEIEKWHQTHPSPLGVRVLSSVQGRCYLNRFISNASLPIAGNREVGGPLTLVGMLECLLGVINDRLKMMIQKEQIVRSTAQPLLSINHSSVDWSEFELSLICTLRAELEAGQPVTPSPSETSPSLPEACIQVLTVLGKHRTSSLTQVRLQEALKVHKYPISEGALRRYLNQLRMHGLVERPSRPRGGDAISQAGHSFLHERRLMIG